MAIIKPTRIPGRWREGFALDYHTVSSTYLGDDEYGNPRFETKRSELGELLYQLKYHTDTSVVAQMVDAAVDFLGKWKPGVEIIVPVPPSRSGRKEQPVLLLASALGKQLGIPVAADCLTRVKETPELKDINDFDERLRLISDAYSVDASKVSTRRVLLFDDLYRSGATMNTLASLLLDHGGAAEVFALAITRTRSKS
jgi:competence protein ComFC